MNRDLLASIGQQMRIPLTTLVGLGEGLKQSTGSMQSAELAQFDHACRRLEQLANDLSESAQAAQLDRTLEKKPVHMRSLLANLNRAIKPACTAYDVIVNFALSSSVPEHLLGSAKRISQVLNNIVDLGIRCAQHDMLAVLVTYKDGHLTARVSTEGPGINEELRREHFSQHGLQETGRYDSPGLTTALSLTQLVVQAMEGELTTYESSGLAEFTLLLSLPMDTAVPPSDLDDDVLSVESEKEPGSLPGDLKLLVVDDDPLSCDIMSGMLRHLGAEVMVCHNGRDAVELVSTHSYDLVFMDCGMAVLNGLEATKQIRDLDLPCAWVPIVAVTTFVLEEDKQACRDAGMNGYLAKPARLDDLERMLLTQLVDGKE